MTAKAKVVSFVSHRVVLNATVEQIDRGKIISTMGTSNFWLKNNYSRLFFVRLRIPPFSDYTIHFIKCILKSKACYLRHYERGIDVINFVLSRGFFFHRFSSLRIIAQMQCAYYNARDVTARVSCDIVHEASSV